MKSIERSIYKTITYRICGFLVTFFVTFSIFDDVKNSLGISVAELLIKPVMYFFHERVWNRIKPVDNKNTIL